jgi:uncharacterized membrane protein required for colicin V production
MTLRRSPVWLLLGVLLGVALALIFYVYVLGEISGVFNGANSEIRGPIFTAISLILVVFVFIIVGAGIVRVIIRSS